eukprot:7081881-Alexandrium_andersonii.AAC.1
MKAESNDIEDTRTLVNSGRGLQGPLLRVLGPRLRGDPWLPGLFFPRAKRGQRGPNVPGEDGCVIVRGRVPWDGRGLTESLLNSFPHKGVLQL